MFLKSISNQYFIKRIYILGDIICPSTLHFKQMAGENTHHILEACFKGMARALRQAVAMETGFENEIPSTKGTLV